MAGTAGKKARVSVAITLAGTYNVILGVQNISFSLDGNNVDVSELGSDFNERVQGLKDAKLSISGNYRPTDTTGQVLIRNAQLADTATFFKVLPDNGVTANAGWNFEGKVASFKVEPSVTDKVAFSAEIELTGAVTAS